MPIENFQLLTKGHLETGDSGAEDFKFPVNGFMGEEELGIAPGTGNRFVSKHTLIIGAAVTTT